MYHPGGDPFIYLGFYVAFNTVQVISRQVVGRADETSTYSSSGFCTVNCQPTASNYQLSHLRPCQELNPGLRGGWRECYHSATVAPGGDPDHSKVVVSSSGYMRSRYREQNSERYRGAIVSQIKPISAL